MISNEIERMLNKQINAEIWSAYLYLSMSIDAERLGYRGVCNWFYIQAHEELDHARMMQKYVTAKDGKVRLLPVSEVPQEWKTPAAMFKAALEHERMVSGKIDELMHAAQKERDYATCSFLSWFVDEQVEEEETCMDLVQQFDKASDAPCYFMQIDFELQKRQYEPSNAKRHSRWFS